MREATEHAPEPTPEQRQLMTSTFKAEQVVKADQEQIARMTRQLTCVTETAKEDLQDQIDVTKAQLELDQDELDDAKEDLLRAGGNPQGKIQQLLQEHEAGSHADATTTNGENEDYRTHN